MAATFIVGPFGGSFQQISGECGIATCEMEGRERAYGVRVLFQPLQQLAGLFEAALPDP